MKINQEDYERARRIGKKRMDSHGIYRSKKHFSDPVEEDMIGVLGEICFEKEFGIPLDERTYNGRGDDGSDFCPNSIKIDVKTFRKAYNLIINEEEIDYGTDIYVLAQYNERDSTVNLLGWEWCKEMKLCPKKVFNPSWGVVNFYKSKEKLKSMEELKKIISS